MVENRLTRVALKHGDQLFSAGCALETLADLLGLGPNDHDLSKEEQSGLIHAIKAIGGLVYAAGCEIYDVAEEAHKSEKQRGKKA